MSEPKVTLTTYQEDFLARRGPLALRRALAALRSAGGPGHSESEKAEARRRAAQHIGWSEPS